MRSICKNQFLSFFFLSFLVTACSYALAGGQTDGFYVSARHNINTGLSSNFIREVYQDNEGFLWIASDNGMNRFDGYVTDIYKPETIGERNFGSLDFNSIAEDKQGNLWFGTVHSGVNVFNKKTEAVTVIDRNGASGHAILDNNINHVFCDSKGRVWISTFDGLNLYCPLTEQMRAFSGEERSGKNDPFGTITYVYEDSNNRILIGTWGNGLYIYDEEADRFTQLTIDSNVLPNDSVNRIYRIKEDHLGNYWLGTWEGGLFKTRIYDYSSLEVLQHYSIHSDETFRIASNIVYSLYQDKGGSVWAGTPYGLHIIKNHQANEPEIVLIQSGEGSHHISQNDVYSIYEDWAGNIWLATGGGGLDMVNPGYQKIASYNIPDIIDLPDNQTIRSILLDRDSVLLTGVHGLGFGEYNLSENKFVHYSEIPRFKGLPKSLNAATCFHEDQIGNLWIGTRYYGLFRICYETHEAEHFLYFDPVTTDRSRLINVIYEDRLGQLWVGTSNGLFKLAKSSHEGKFEIFRFLPERDNDQSLQGEFISTIFEDSNDQLWIGTVGGGLSVVKNHDDRHSPLNFNHFKAKKDKPGSIRSNIIYSIRENKHGQLFIGTGTAGLALYHPENNSFTHFFRDEGFREDAVYDIIEDGRNLWLTTNRGIIRFSQEQLPGMDYRVEVFTSEDGFQSDVFINNASYRADDGRIFVGGYHGFNVFHADDLFRNTYVPPLAITGIRAGGEKINVYEALENGLDIKHNQNNFRISFSALSFFHSKKNIYAHKLEGLDPDWRKTDHDGRVISYAYLPAGSYTLKMKGANSSGVWNESYISLPITIKPHPLRSWWAMVLYATLITIIVVIVYYFLISNYRIKQAYAIEKIERKKEENLNQFKFRFFTNISHELLTPLSVLSFSIEDLSLNKLKDNGTLDIMDRNVKRIMHLISQLLDFRKVEKGSMKPLVSPVNTSLFIEKMSSSLQPLADKKNITVLLRGHIDKTIYFDLDKMEKILCNLLGNAVKYTPEGGKILIRYHLYDKKEIKWLQVDVIDSGKGIEADKIDKVFERFYQVKSVTGRTFSVGIGLALAKSLVENHKGFIHVKNEKGMGARFSINIPVSPEAYDKVEILEEEVDYQSQRFIMDCSDSLLPEQEEDDNDIQCQEEDPTKTLLIVEDNHDFRQLLKRHMDNYYDVLEAENGETGYRVCLEKQPDIVITDMMMPVMNGIQLCKRIKNNINTSHIIVIMLTAKTNEETRYQSYLANADSYIAKPVDVRTLHTRVESLLARHDQMKQKYASGKMPFFDRNGISRLDREFLKNVKSIVADKLTNTEMNVHALSMEVGMSKSNLYRKIIKLTGMSPVEFIRYIRLQSAAEMIVKEGLNVSEAAYACGFNDLSYFSKSFKKLFGTSPKKFQQKAFPNN